MSTYYYLLNDTKKERVHFDNCIKHGALTTNTQVQSALINYMMDNQEDSMRLMPDYGYDGIDYKEINLAVMANSI
jgi:hypothetical protein